jgi:hypothetical protein
MMLVIAQFIAYFNYSNIATVVAIQLGDVLHTANIGGVWLLILFVLVILLLDIIIPGAIPKWAIFAPIFVPLFYRLGIGAQTVLAAYRVGDSPLTVVTPLMVYLPFIVIVSQRYKKDAGIGTVISLMLPYAVVVGIASLLFFLAWYGLGIPLGPGAPVRLRGGPALTPASRPGTCRYARTCGPRWTRPTRLTAAWRPATSPMSIRRCPKSPRTRSGYVSRVWTAACTPQAMRGRRSRS